jgi:hypothetical protein
MDRVNTVGILHSNWVTEESIRSGSPVIEILGQQLWRGLLAFGAGTDTSQAYNAGRPLLSISHSILLAIGLFLVLTRIRQFRHYIVAAWLGVALIFAGALVNEPVSSHRLLIASPVVYLLIGLAVVWLAQHLLQSFRVPLNYLLPASATVAVVLVAADVLFYFGAFQSSHQYGDRNTEIAHEAATYIDSLDGEWDIYFHGPPSMYNSFPTFAYLIEDWQTGKIMIDVPSQESPHIAENNKSTLYLVLPERSDEIPNIEHLNPGGSLQSFEGYNASPLFYTYEIR